MTERRNDRFSVSVVARIDDSLREPPVDEKRFLPFFPSAHEPK